MTQTVIPYGRQDITEADIQAVIEVLRSDWLTQGPVIPEFETAMARYCGAEFAVAVSNGTAALHLACLALGLGPGDWLWTTPNTFVASANCALYCGAQVDFVDIDELTYNLSVPALARKLEQAKQVGRLPKIVIPVHFAGQPCDMPAIKALADEYGFSIVEDACHAIGASYQGKKVGSCQLSDITVFSFHPVKLMTTAEGGLLTTNQPELAERLSLLRTHGITKDVEECRNQTEGGWYYEQQQLGFNYRITDLQCALGLSQLGRLDDYIAKRQALAAHYTTALADQPLLPQQQNVDSYSAFHLYVINLELAKLQQTRADIFCALRDAGVGVHVHYIPVHLQPYYQDKGFKVGDYPVAEKYYASALTLPLWPQMGVAADKVVSTLIDVLNQE